MNGKKVLCGMLITDLLFGNLFLDIFAIKIVSPWLTENVTESPYFFICSLTKFEELCFKQKNIQISVCESII